MTDETKIKPAFFQSTLGKEAQEYINQRMQTIKLSGGTNSLDSLLELEGTLDKYFIGQLQQVINPVVVAHVEVQAEIAPVVQAEIAPVVQAEVPVPVEAPVVQAEVPVPVEAPVEVPVAPAEAPVPVEAPVVQAEVAPVPVEAPVVQAEVAPVPVETPAEVPVPTEVPVAQE